MSGKCSKGFLFLIAAVLTFALIAPAQEVGRIGGSVTDASGAVVPGASVAITNMGTNITKTVVTNEQGRFVAPNLFPGEYRVVVELAGFKKFVQTGIVLRVGDSLDMTVAMDLGQVSEQITVSGDTPLLQATTSSVGEVVESKMVSDLPLNTRQPLSLVVLTPGVVPNRQMENAAQPFNRAGNFSISGGRGVSNEILMDGTPNTVPEGSTGSFTAVTVFPTVESTQEFKVQSNTYAAEYGRSGGGVVNIVTKSGTNALHGSLFEFVRNSVFDSNDFFNNRNKIKLASFKRNQFGGAVGGPIVIPKIYNGRNRTFFFTSWESLVERGGTTVTTTVPTALQKNGDFSQTLNAAGQRVVIYDPMTSTFDPATSRYNRTAFANNIIPQARMDPIGRRLMSFFPDPNGPGAPLTGANNFNVSQSRPIDDHRFDLRMDQQIGDKHRVYGRYGFSRRDWSIPNLYGNIGDPLARTYPSDPTSVKAGYTYTLNANYLLDVKYAYNHLYFAQMPASDGFDLSELGFPKYMYERAQSKEFPRITFTEFGLGLGHSSNTMNGRQDSNIFMSSISRNVGNHSTKIGFEARRDRANRFTITSGTYGFAFTRGFTQGPNAAAASTTAGHAGASALLGAADSGRLSMTINRRTQSWYHAYYVQDDWRVTRKLTVNLGLRYDLQFPMVERENNMNWFDPEAASPIAGRVPGLPLKGAVVFATDGKRHRWTTNVRDFAPRIGLAYQATRGTVLRAAYGMFFAPHPYGTSDGTGVGYSTSTPYVSSIDGATPTGRLSDPFPNGFVLPIGLGGEASPNVNLGLAMSWYEPASPTPYVQQWNFAIQRQVGQTLAFDVSYVGAKGTHLPDVGYYLSQLPASMLGPHLIESVTNPFAGVITIGTLAQPRVQRRELLKPYPQYTSVLNRFSTGASSIYHSAQFKVTKRFSNDLNFLGAYTIGKLIDDNSGLMDWLEPATGHQDAYNRRADRAISDQDVSQRFVFTFNYGLPFGRNKTFGRNWHPVVNHILGGWQTNGIVVMQTGVPLAITASNTSQSGNSVLRANVNGKSAEINGDRSRDEQLSRWFDTSVFSQPAPYTFGNGPRNLPDVRGPSLAALDASLFKNIYFSEARYLQLRGEFFNLTNTPEFNNPDTAFQSSTFGRITSQRNRPRQIQLGLRLVF